MPNIICALSDWKTVCEMSVKLIGGIGAGKDQFRSGLFYVPVGDTFPRIKPCRPKHKVTDGEGHVYMGFPKKAVWLGWGWISSKPDGDLLVLTNESTAFSFKRKWALRFESAGVASNLVVHFALAAKDGTLGFVFVDDMEPFRRAFNENKALWKGQEAKAEEFINTVHDWVDFFNPAKYESLTA